MIFASDLDRTLIYSEKFIVGFAEKSIKIRPVEYKEGKIISYMSEKVISKLKSISENVLFIPVTTRTIEQYERIDVFKNLIKPQYAIVTNGGNILKDGRLDVNWNKKIKNKIKHECLSIDEVINKFKEIASDRWILKSRKADDLFLYYIIDREKMAMNELNDFVKWLRNKNWRSVLHGRKLYFIPNCVNKRESLSYISEKEGREIIIAAGDSILDLDMAEIADYFISPRHGELYNTYREKVKHEFIFTENIGFVASHEIVEKVMQNLLAGAKI
ncbi:Hydroxymethylpyrimidine pyrophosphatase [Caminicella sporogenes DSM 14501]|uniref:Hydroxymethylpyrimidine pyrophosphatase n=1 Tax=Caminicella sporogenes DSM 14501 TaxID=1121266 RepID=A0A1M6QL46_9FIRM|nr:HAD family hydrolase [Caminicella sporogenes]RKD25273.1 hypothetical protein BET04_03395 [Caminicella sporogenes]SHK20984.1 Hydroxymethylpyrimidine pyrophosphatase [Caminicella sporogenes DSM 14501]